jgi:hypothetical protein
MKPLVAQARVELLLAPRRGQGVLISLRPPGPAALIRASTVSPI